MKGVSSIPAMLDKSAGLGKISLMNGAPGSSGNKNQRLPSEPTTSLTFQSNPCRLEHLASHCELSSTLSAEGDQRRSRPEMTFMKQVCSSYLAQQEASGENADYQLPATQDFADEDNSSYSSPAQTPANYDFDRHLVHATWSLPTGSPLEFADRYPRMQSHIPIPWSMKCHQRVMPRRIRTGRLTSSDSTMILLTN